MPTRDTYAPSNSDRLADWYAKAALAGMLSGNNHFKFPRAKK